MSVSPISLGVTATWLSDAMVAIKNQQNQGGLLGMLQNAGGDGSVSSFLNSTAKSASALATISQSSVTNAGTFYAQMASANLRQRRAEKLQQQLDQAAKPVVQPKSMLSPILYFNDGSTIDTVNNILTRPDGSQWDTLTGARYLDPASIVQMANGAYLNTKTNILTMPDGTQIGTVTGLKVSTTA
jgi:hypothetical protein